MQSIVTDQSQNGTRRNLSQVIEEYTVRCKSLPPVEPEKPASLWQKLKTTAVAHITRTHALTRKRLETILNKSPLQVHRLVEELLSEGAIEEEDGKLYPAGTLANKPPLFVPAPDRLDALKVYRVEDLAEEAIEPPAPMPVAKEPKPSAKPKPQLDRTVQALERIETALAELEAQQVQFSIKSVCDRAKVSKSTLLNHPAVHHRVRLASSNSRKLKPENVVPEDSPRAETPEVSEPPESASPRTEVPSVPIAWLIGERMFWEGRVAQLQAQLAQLQADLDSAALNFACCDRLIQISDQEGK